MYDEAGHLVGEYDTSGADALPEHDSFGITGMTTGAGGPGKLSPAADRLALILELATLA